MKVLLTAYFSFFLAAGVCNNDGKGQKFKGRLEIDGICMNYTIKVIEGSPGSGLFESKWTDEVTNISYSDVFRLGNPCSFPQKIKRGDEFYFVIDSSKQKECAVCMAYYPAPSKILSIKVIE